MMMSTLEAGRLADNVVHFARLLRDAGLPVGTDRIALALQALPIAGIGSPDTLHDALRACLLTRVEQQSLFEQAFCMFWSTPDVLSAQSAVTADRFRMNDTARALQQGISQRLLDAFVRDGHLEQQSIERAERAVEQTQPSSSDCERLRRMDFESMSAEEYQTAQRVIETIEPLLLRLRTRREVPSKDGVRIDLRRLLRDAGRSGGDVAHLPRKVRRTQPEPLCVIVDISGSMSRYSRMFLQFVHAIMNCQRASSVRTRAFVFGTRLSHITNLLEHADPDEAIANVCQHVQDWSGGTRIGACLKEFNQQWVRRLSLSRSTVLLVTDGLEHAQIELLAEQAAWLARSCKRLLWLNPLLRYDAFQPTARGIRALLPHVDRMLPVHNIKSLEQLLVALSSAYGNER
jgi:uncharacterized protein with von Willebrand factor type A (vWA) domain